MWVYFRLNTDSRPSLGKLRPRNRSMSIDDIEAAAQHQARKMAEMPTGLRASTGHLKHESSSVQVNVGDDLNEDRDEPDSTPNVSSSSTVKNEPKPSEINNNSEDHEEIESSLDFVQETIKIEGSPLPNKKVFKAKAPAPVPELKPLPNQRFRKKNAANEWDAVLQKRLTGEVKERELEQSVSQILATSSRETGLSPQTALVDIDIETQGATSVEGPSHLNKAESPDSWSSVQRKRSMEFLGTNNPNNKFGSFRLKNLTTPAWLDSQDGNVISANPAYSYANDIDDNVVINMTQNKERRQPKVRKTIAMFENFNRDHMTNEPIYVKRGMSPGRAISPGRGISPGRPVSPSKSISPGRGLSPGPAKSPRTTRHVIQAGIRPNSPHQNRHMERPSRRDYYDNTPQSSRTDMASSHSTIVKVDNSRDDSSQVFTIVKKVDNNERNHDDTEQSVTVVEIARL